MTPENEDDIYRAQPEPIIPSEDRPQFTPPSALAEPEEVELKSVQPELEEDELADLFEVPQQEDNDMVVDHLVATPEPEDVSDLTAVSDEDVMGEEIEDFPGTPPATEIPQRTKPVRRFKRTNKRFQTPPTSLGGVRG